MELRLTVPLKAGWRTNPKHSRANRAVNDLRAGIITRTKAVSVTLSPKLNEALWSNGRRQPPTRITVLIDLNAGAAAARLPDEAAPKPTKAEAKASKAEAVKTKKPAPAAEAEQIVEPASSAEPKIEEV